MRKTKNVGAPVVCVSAFMCAGVEVNHTNSRAHSPLGSESKNKVFWMQRAQKGGGKEKRGQNVCAATKKGAQGRMGGERGTASKVGRGVRTAVASKRPRRQHSSSTIKGEKGGACAAGRRRRPPLAKPPESRAASPCVDQKRHDTERRGEESLESGREWEICVRSRHHHHGSERESVSVKRE